MMRAIFAALMLLCCAQTGHAEEYCPNTEVDRGFREGLPVKDEPEIISGAIPLFEGGVITCHISPDYGNVRQNRRYRVETGALNGIKYRIYYTDGSGTIQGDPAATLDTIKDLQLTNWSARCEIDGMDDERWCALTKKDLMIGIWKDGSTFVNVGHDHFPSSQIAIRIDKNAPFTANETSGFSGKQVSGILSSFRSGEKALTRYREWPYETNIDVTIDLYGFNEAWDVLTRVYEAR